MSTIFLILCVCVYWDLMVVGFSDKKASNEWLMWPALPVWESDTRSRSGSSAPQYGERPLSHNSELENVEFPRPLLNPPRHIKHYIYSCFTIKSKLPWLQFPDFVLWWAASELQNVIFLHRSFLSNQIYPKKKRVNCDRFVYILSIKWA